MSILAANLKHLYQRRGAWLWYFLILCLTAMFILPPRLQGGSYLGYLFASLLAGILAGDMQKEVLIKPFSFCLPGHRRIVRPFIFWIGGVVNLVFGCVFLGYPGLGFPYVLLIVLTGGFVGMIVYFYGVYIGFSEMPNPSWGIVLLLIIGAIFWQWDKILQDVIVSWPIVVILVSGSVCVWVWRLLGRDFLARRYCGKLVMGMIIDWNQQKNEKYQQARAYRYLTEAKTKSYEKTLEFFLHRMKQYEFLSKGRYVWGNLCMVLGFWQMKRILGLLAMITFFPLAFGFMGHGGRMINFLFLIPACGVLGLDLLPYRTMLVPAGRAEKYFGALILSVIITFLAGLLVLAMTGVSAFLETSLPEFILGGKTFSYHRMDISQFYNYLLSMPIVLSMTVVFPRNKLFRIAFAVVFTQGWMIFEMESKQTLTDVVGQIGVVGLVVLSWVGFLVFLRYICMRRSLVGKGR